MTTENKSEIINQDARQNLKDDDGSPEEQIKEEFSEEKKQELIKELIDRGAATQNKLTYTIIADITESAELDKNQMDDIYDTLISKGIELVSETEPEDFEIVLEEDDLAEDPDEIIREANEMDLEASIPKGVADRKSVV